MAIEDGLHENNTQDSDDDGSRRLEEDLVTALYKETRGSAVAGGDNNEGAHEVQRARDYPERAHGRLKQPGESGVGFQQSILSEHQGRRNGQHGGSIYESQMYDLERNPPLSNPSRDATVVGLESVEVKQITPTFTPSDRSLPSPNVTDETLDDAYVQFILYCNPSIPLNCDTSELRKAFRLPPKSDGKIFNMYDLLRLIEKLEQKQIKTWTRLATVLGVERKSDQSTQKVQQYAVRLKRWMHAMHIDAFFEYCLGKQHPYFTEIPAQSEQGLKEPRDGVPVEEDLALRALRPENRPKRGRRKADDKNDDGAERETPQSKRLMLDTSTPTITRPVVDHFALYSANSSAAPNSAEQDGIDSYLREGQTPSSCPETLAAFNGGSASSTIPPVNPHHMHPISSDIVTPQQTTPTSAISYDTPRDEAATPLSATPTSGPKRARRFHGPAVSSAWPSSRNPRTGKLRGRPPQNCSVRDGPFSTFPANPQSKGLAADLGSNTMGTPTSTPVAPSSSQPFSFIPQNARPPNLQVQVPQQASPLVTVATPVHTKPNGMALEENSEYKELENRFAANLLQGVALGLHIDDTKQIARKLIDDLIKHHASTPRIGANSTLEILLGCHGNMTALMRDFKVERLSSLGPVPTSDQREQNSPGSEQFRVSWKLGFGPLTGEFSQIIKLENYSHMSSAFNKTQPNLSGLGLHAIGEPRSEHFETRNTSNSMNVRRGLSPTTGGIDGEDDPESIHDWKRRYYDMERRLRQKEDEIAQMARRVLHAIMG